MLAIIGSAEELKTDNEKLAKIIGGGKHSLHHTFPAKL
jgi:hypothetical protein